MAKRDFIVGQLYRLTRQTYGMPLGHVVVILEVDITPTSKNRITICTTDPVGDPEYDTTVVGIRYEKFLTRYKPR